MHTILHFEQSHIHQVRIVSGGYESLVINANVAVTCEWRGQTETSFEVEVTQNNRIVQLRLNCSRVQLNCVDSECMNCMIAARRYR